MPRGKPGYGRPSSCPVLAGGLALWAGRVAPIDDGGLFAWIVNERSRGPAALPAREIDYAPTAGLAIQPSCSSSAFAAVTNVRACSTSSVAPSKVKTNSAV